ncbi:MAG: sugar phosphate nucleotidyltransferase [Sulfobacillus sp.]
MNAFILAGGRGTRLEPLTLTRPKPLVPLVDRPILDNILRHLQSGGFDHIVMLVGFKGSEIAQYAGTGGAWGVNLQYHYEPEPLGTAGSLIDALAQHPMHEAFLVVSGDGLTNLNLSAFYQACQKAHAEVGILLARVDDPRRFGVVKTNKSGHVTGFVEKPQKPGPNAWVNTGIYYFEPRVLQRLPLGQPLDFGFDLFPRWVAEGHCMIGVKSEGYWSDVGTLVEYRRAIADILAGRIEIPTTPNPKITVSNSGFKAMPPVFIDELATIEPGAIVGPFTVIGSRTYVGRGAKVEASIVREKTWIGAGAQISGVVVGEGSYIGTGAILDEGVVMGDHSWVGAATHVASGTHIAPDTVLVANSARGASAASPQKALAN